MTLLSSLTRKWPTKSGLDMKSPTESITEPSGPHELPAATRRMILVGTWLAQFLSALNLTLVPTMLPSISSEFKRSNEAAWVGTAYMLATCTFTPLYGRLSNVLGRNGANQSAIIFAAVGIVVCGLSKSMGVLIAARFICGMGGGGIFTTSAIITSDMYTMRSRSYIQSIGGIFYGLGMGLGGPIGGIITDWLGWRWAFLIQIPLFVVAYLLTTCNLTYKIPGSGENVKEILKRIDYGGTLTLLGAVGSLLIFMSLKFHDTLPMNTPTVILALIGSVVFTVLFLIIEIYVAVEPILPTNLLTQRVPVLVGVSNALVSVTNLSVTYYYPTWFQTVMMSSASTAGLHLLPNSICISGGSFFAGWMMKRYGKYKLLNMTFGILPFCGAILMSQMKQTSNQAHLWISIMPFGFGNAIVLQTLFMALVSNLPESQMAVGTGFTQLVRGLGQVGGLGLGSAVFQSRLAVELHKRFPDDAELVERIRESARLVVELPPEAQQLARDAYAASIKCVFILAASASLLAYIMRIPIPDTKLEDTDPVPDGGDNPVPMLSPPDEERTPAGSGSSSVFEEARDDEGKVVKPLQN